MPRIAKIFQQKKVNAIERRIKGAGSGDEGSGEMTVLIDIIRQRDEEIKRLKSTDAKRQSSYLKQSKKWRAKQAEARRLRSRNQTFRRLLSLRRQRIREFLERLRVLEQRETLGAKFQALRLAGETVPVSFVDSPPANMFEWVARRWSRLSLVPWRHWMRLGSYTQYDPRPVELDTLPLPKTPLDQLPKISLVTPSYQQAQYLEKTLRSVIDEGYPNLQHLVMDGGSTDGSVEVIKRYEKHLSYWQSQKDGGQAAAVRAGLVKCDGEIMAWLNSDDVIFPGTLAYVADYFHRHPNVDMVYGHRILIDPNDFETGRWVLPRHDSGLLAWADFIPQECAFWRRRIYEKVGGINPDYRFALDWDLFLRFQLAGAKIVRLPYFMGGFRIHPEQKNAVTITTDGWQEMGKIRQASLGEHYNLTGLQKRLHWLQAKAVMTTMLWRCGIRY